MTTINQVCKAVINAAIDHDYIDGFGPGSWTLTGVYLNEYGSWNGTTPKACTDYIQGLPSVCTVPFYNSEILELLAKHGITRKSEDAQARLIDDYWKACGNAFYNLVK
jgi:hypothetical protein